jgi:hypothetical protein
MDVDCLGTSDGGAVVYIRVTQPTSEDVFYSITYHD